MRKLQLGNDASCIPDGVNLLRTPIDHLLAEKYIFPGLTGRYVKRRF